MSARAAVCTNRSSNGAEPSEEPSANLIFLLVTYMNIICNYALLQYMLGRPLGLDGSEDCDGGSVLISSTRSVWEIAKLLAEWSSICGVAISRLCLVETKIGIRLSGLMPNQDVTSSSELRPIAVPSWLQNHRHALVCYIQSIANSAFAAQTNT